jgi:glutamyl-Q tRNA(Asp) synthetase
MACQLGCDAQMSNSVFRFAPSPNGYLHLGHALSALANFDMARAVGGKLLLRIENIDPARCRLEYEEAICDDLAWLGIAWEQPVRRQSEHLADYQAALSRLDLLGLIYPSFESRAEIAELVAARERHGPWPRDPDGAPLYPGSAAALPAAERARMISDGALHVMRLDMKAALALVGDLSWLETDSSTERSEVIGADPAAWGDVVLARRDVPTSYHLSVVVDDALQGVTHVVRGADLFHATGVHRLLQELLGLPAPTYHHHQVLRDRDGNKLSKSTHATGLRELRQQGAGPIEIRRMVGLG